MEVEHHDVGLFAISVAFCDDGRLLLASDTELAYWSPGSGIAEHIAAAPFDTGAVRSNDGKWGRRSSRM